MLRSKGRTTEDDVQIYSHPINQRVTKSQVTQLDFIKNVLPEYTGAVICLGLASWLYTLLIK